MKSLIDQIQHFSDSRAWGEFHTPKNLSCALIAEAAELLEFFTWMKESDLDSIDPDTWSKIKLEVADIFIYLALFSNRLNIDIDKAVKEKLDINETRFPVDSVLHKRLDKR